MSDWPIPKPIDPINAEFWQSCQDGVLRFQRCTACGKFRHLPRYLCASCGSNEYEWAPVSTTGSLYSWTVTRQIFHPAFDVPFVAAVVEFPEGVRMVSHLLDAEVEDLTLGAAVCVEFKNVGEDFKTPVFRLAV
jgi:uncharacterized protein